MQLGFIGLGIMGKPMVRNLLRAGYSVLVWNRSQAAVDQCVADGAVAATPRELGERCDVVLTMLPDSPQVRQVVLEDPGIAAYLRPGTVLIDCSSINPVASREIAAALAERGVEMLDAPVSGGEPKAVDGTLAFMVGGKEAVLQQVRPVLEAMGSSVVHCGAVGAGNTTKLANQILVACHIQALAEALSLAQKAGVDPAVVVQAIRGGLAGSAVMEAKAAMMLSGDDRPGFKAALHRKDLDNVLACAGSVGAYVPMTAAAQQVLRWLDANGGGQSDHSAMARYYETLDGLRLGRTE